MNDVTPPRRLPPVGERPNNSPKKDQPIATPPADTPAQATEPDSFFSEPQGEATDPLFELPKKRRWVKWLLVIGGVLLVLAAVAAFVGYTWYQDALQARSDNSDAVRITVESGDTSDAVAANLQQKGIIKSALALQIYIKLNGKGDIKAGNYLFAPNQSPTEIVGWMNEGRVDTFKVTILPGQTLVDLKKALQKYHYTSEAIDAAFAKQYSHPLLADKPANIGLEGYIYPETYFVGSDLTVEQLLVVTFDEFEKQIDAHSLRPTLAQQNFNLHQGITLASIIEKEVTGEADQRQVSQVFQKRLKEGMALGSDVTYHYAASLLGVAPSPEIDSPYNTRKTPGLPPGPIANFTIKTLQAVAEPATGDYLFFVAGDDGTTHFARTDQEHNANIDKYCKKLCATY